MFSYQVIIPVGIKPYPEKYELTAADLLAQFFQTNVTFIKQTNHKTPDFKIGNISWELKSPTGNGKRNIQHQLQKAFKQSSNIIFDARRSKIHITKIKNELNYQLKITKGIKKLILIDKASQVVALKP